MSAGDSAHTATDQPLAGRVAIVTGVSRRVGIGLAVARRLAALGADLLVTSWTAHDRDQPWGADPGGMEAVLAELTAQQAAPDLAPAAGPAGGRVAHLEVDFLDPDAPERVLAAAVKAYGHMDMLICNHARSSDGGLGELTAAEVDAVFPSTPERCCCSSRRSPPGRRPPRRQGGAVHLRAAAGAHVGELAYAASKAALAGITVSLADTLADRGSR